MVLISKHDKKVWDKYILNFEKTVIHTNENTTINNENQKIKRNIYKNNKLKNNNKSKLKDSIKNKINKNGYYIYKKNSSMIKK